MDVNKKINIQLVQTVEKYPCLYNSELKEYSKREFTERAWIEVAEELVSTPDVVKERWKSFRSVFVRRLKQMHMGELIKPYYLHEHMQFVMPYLQNRWDPESRTKRMLEESESRVAKYSFTSKRENSIEIEGTYDVVDNIDPVNVNSICLEDSAEQQRTRASIKRPRISSAASEEDFHGFSEYQSCELETPAKQRQIRDASYLPQPTEDHDTTDNNNAKRLFMLSLMPDLEEMNNAQMREFKTRVVTLINEIFEDNLA